MGPKLQWICQLSAMGPVCITFVSTLTITGIAIDRYEWNECFDSLISHYYSPSNWQFGALFRVAANLIKTFFFLERADFVRLIQIFLSRLAISVSVEREVSQDLSVDATLNHRQKSKQQLTNFCMEASI